MGQRREETKRRSLIRRAIDAVKGSYVGDGWVRIGQYYYHPIHGRLPVLGGGTTAAFSQTRFRWRNDDGSETTATWKAAEDIDIVLPVSALDTNIRLRIQVDETAGGSSANFVGQLRYSKNGGAYADVNGTSSDARSAASGNFSDEAATTNQLAAATGTFLTGAMDEANGAAGTTQVDFSAGQFTEFEWCFQIRSSDVARGDTLDFRCYRSSNALNAYQKTARIHIAQDIAAPAGAVTVGTQTPEIGHGLAVAVGAIAITGLSVGVGFKAPDVGAVTLTGLAPTATVEEGTAKTISVPAGSVSVGGQPPILAFGLSHGAGSVAVTGQATTLAFGVGTDTGAVTVTGNTPALLYTIAVPAGSLAVTGQQPAVLGGGAIAAGLGAVAVTGNTPSLGIGISSGTNPQTPPTAVNYAGQAPTLSVGTSSPAIAVPAGSLSFSGGLVGVGFRAPQTGSLVFTGQTPSLSLGPGGPGITIAVPPGAVAFSGTYIAVEFLGPDSGAVVFTGLAPVIIAGTNPPAGVITITGYAPTLVFPAVSPSAGSITLIGQPPSPGRGIGVNVGTTFFTGQTPSAVLTIGALGVPTGTITITGLSFTPAYELPTGAATITITGLTPVVDIGFPIPIGAITITPQAETLAFGISVPVGAVAVAGEVPMASAPGQIVAETGSVTFTGQVPLVLVGLGMPAGQIAFVGLAPFALTAHFIEVPAGAITFEGLEPRFGQVAFVPVGAITITGRVPVVALAGDAPTNQTAPTARNLRPFGITQFQDVHVAGTTYTVWYYFTAIAGEDMVDVFAWGGGGDYQPFITVYTGPDANTIDQLLSIEASQRPVQVPVVTGQTYWVEVGFNAPPLNPQPADLEITGRAFTNQSAPSGSILVPDDFSGLPGAILDSTTGLPIRFVQPFPAGESAYVLDDGYILTEDITIGVKLYSPSLALIATRTWNPSGTNAGFIAGRGDRFYVANSSSASNAEMPALSVRTINKDGTYGPTTWFPGFSVNAIAIGVSPDHSVLYWHTAFPDSPTNLHRFDLINNVALPSLAVGPTGMNRVRQILVLNDGTILAGYASSPNFVIRRYDPTSGAVLNTYSFTGLNLGDIGDNQIGLALDDPISFWVWLKEEQGLSRFVRLRTSDGAVLEQTPLVPQYEIGSYQAEATPTPIAWFGHSESCPFVLLRAPLGEEIANPEPPVITDDRDTIPTFDSICIQVSRRLGDIDHRIWSGVEIDNYLLQGVKEMCTKCRLIWDWVYPENLPRGFSFTSAFEQTVIEEGNEGIIWKYGQGDGMGEGLANYTFEAERRMYPSIPNGAQTKADEDIREGPARHTFPDEIPFLQQLGSDQQQGTAELPHRLTEMERSAWDKRTIQADSHRFLAPRDSRYEIERGEVSAYTWRKDGPRTFRKVRVPAALADTYEIDGIWGIARDLDDTTNDVMEGTWGIPRIVAGHHPIGPFFAYRMWGTPRRFFRDGKNVKVEHWRIPYFDCFDSELPPRYRQYLVYYAMWRCLSRQGPGQDIKLANWYKERWNVALTRINRRIDRQRKERTGRMGGPDDGPPSGHPPRPRLPWQFGKRMR